MSTVLITGASSGFGRASAQKFAASGKKLILAARRQDRLDELAASLDVPVHTASLDVRSREGVQAFQGSGVDRHIK